MIVPKYFIPDSFYDFTSTTDKFTKLSENLSESFAFDDLKTEFESTYDETTTTTEASTTHYVISSMRVERYYASVKEEVSKLTPAATTLLERRDYIGFFKACGPNYVRSIRRVQEVTAMFKFESSNTDTAQEFASSLQTTSLSGEGTETVTSSSKFESITSSMEIKIVGFGLGLTKEGGDTLMATSLAEFNGVMKFAYNVMTKAPDAHHIGMVYGIEVVPWVENAEFQVTAAIQDENVEIPIPRSLMARAYRASNKTDTNFVESDRTLFTCKNSAYSIDRYGYCCEAPSLYNQALAQYVITDDLSTVTCRPIRTLDGSIVKENMSGNGEFVARLDRALRYKSNVLSTLQKCISTIRSYPSTVDRNYLRPNSDPFGLNEVKLTVFDMKMAMDPFNDYSMVKHMGKELDEFIDMYYAPCLAALFGANAPSSETDTSYFLAYPWHTHKECTYMSCLANGMRWDREEGGCVPGLMSGGTQKNYTDSSDAKCSYDIDSEDTVQVCKYPAADLNDFTEKVGNCWQSSTTMTTGFSVQLYMDNYCMPQVSADKMDLVEFNSMTNSISPECGGTQGVSSSNSAPARKYSVIELHNQKKQRENRRRRNL